MKREEIFDVFHIDMNRLDEQVAEHSFLFVVYSKKLKKAKRELVRLKTKLEDLAASIGMRIVKSPKTYKLEGKPTKQMIDFATTKTAKYKKAKSNLDDQQEKVNDWQIIVSAFEHRKRMLTEANEMHSKQYFSTPYIASSENAMIKEQLKKQRVRRKTQKSKK